MLPAMVIDPDLATVQQRLVYALRLRRMSAEAVDREIGRKKYTAYIANGTTLRPGVDVIEPIARALHVDPAWLAWGKGPTPRADEPATVAA